MKIAVIGEDGTRISQHFGRAPLYVVVIVEGGRVISKETRAKAGHNTFAANKHTDSIPEERHGYDAGGTGKAQYYCLLFLESSICKIYTRSSFY